MSYSKLALGNLKQRKKQYILLIIGIILSMVFSSSALFLVVGASSSFQKLNNYKFGVADALIYNIQLSSTGIKHLDELFPNNGKLHIIGYGYNPQGDEEDGTSIAYLDENAMKLYEPIIVDGKYPENKGEIAIEEKALKLLKTDTQIGDKITFKFSVQNGDNYLEKTINKEYTLVGILKDKRYNLENERYLTFEGTKHTPEVPAAFVSNKEKVELGGKESVTGAILHSDYTGVMTDGYYNLYYDYIERENYSYSQILSTHNSDDMMFYDVFYIGSPMFLTFVICVVLLLVANLGIINAFSTNLKERKKQIGLLRSVGATKRQIRNIYLREAAVLCLICTPISTLISALGVSVIVKAFNEIYVFRPTWWTFPLGIIISILVVIFAALFPLFSASKITPMQAIRDVNFTYKMLKKKIKTQKEFDAPKLIAKRNMTFFKTTNVLTSLILTLAIAFSLCAFSIFNDLADLDGSYLYEQPDYYISNFGGHFNTHANYANTRLTENDKQDLLNIDGVSSVQGCKENAAFILTENYSDFERLCLYDSHYFESNPPIGPEGVTEEFTKETYKEMFENENSQDSLTIKKDLKINEKTYPITLFGFDEEYISRLKENVIYGEINEKKLNSGEEIILVAPKELALINCTYDYDDSGARHLITRVPGTELYDRDMKNNGEIFETAKNDFNIGDTVNFGWARTNSNYFYLNQLSDDSNQKFDPAKVKYDYIKSTAKIGAIVYELPTAKPASVTVFADGINIATTLDGFDNFTKDVNYTVLTTNLNTEITPELNDEIMNKFDEMSSENNNTHKFSKYESKLDDENTSNSLYIMALCVSILFFTMCGSMVNNSITARIRESKKKIGTLRAVGASTKELTVTYVRQLVVILTSGTVGGLALTVLIYALFAIYTMVYKSGTIPAIKPSIMETGIAIILLFTSCSLNMYFKIKKEMKNSIVENIREL